MRLVDPVKYMLVLQELRSQKAEKRARYHLKHSQKLQGAHEHLMQQKNAPVSLPPPFPPKPNMLRQWQNKIAAETQYENLAGYNSGMNLDHKLGYREGEYGSVIPGSDYQPPKPKPDMTRPGWWKKRRC
jgi:hypothetical protein